MSRVHLVEDSWGAGTHWEVWLDTDVGEQDGLCIGSGATRDQAVADAVTELEAALEELQHPPFEPLPTGGQ